jgi:hypothetical protein
MLSRRGGDPFDPDQRGTTGTCGVLKQIVAQGGGTLLRGAAATTRRWADVNSA